MAPKAPAVGAAEVLRRKNVADKATARRDHWQLKSLMAQKKLEKAHTALQKAMGREVEAWSAMDRAMTAHMLAVHAMENA